MEKEFQKNSEKINFDQMDPSNGQFNHYKTIQQISGILYFPQKRGFHNY